MNERDKISADIVFITASLILPLFVLKLDVACSRAVHRHLEPGTRAGAFRYIKCDTLNSVVFEWDPAKAAANKRKHGVSFEDAATCFQDPLALILDDPRYPERFILIGSSSRQKLIFTVFVERAAAVIRIIRARRATIRERRKYEEGDY
jgi:uncharacterized protein